MRASDLRTFESIDGIVLMQGHNPHPWDDWCVENAQGRWNRTTKHFQIMLGSALRMSDHYQHAYAFEKEGDHILFKLRWTS